MEHSQHVPIMLSQIVFPMSSVKLKTESEQAGSSHGGRLPNVAIKGPRRAEKGTGTYEEGELVPLVLALHGDG